MEEGGMSFVNLMVDVRWSEHDIVQRMEAMIREHCSATEELILHRKMLGASINAYDLSAGEQAEIATYAGVCAVAQQAGRDARADMALLTQAFDVEAAQRRLALPQVEPILDPEDPALVLNGLEVFADQEQRTTAQALIDAAAQAVLDLVAARAAARAAPSEPEVQP
jgi:hypothetical protein